MSGSTTAPVAPNASATSGTPSPARTVETAADDIEGILASEAGQPAPAPKPRRAPPAPAPAQPAAPPKPKPEGETPADPEEEPADEEELDLEEEEPEGEGDGEQEEEPGDEPADDAEVTVEVDGKPTRVKLADLKQGYLRTADYTRKTMALAEERKTFQAEAEQTRQERVRYAQLLPQMAKQLQQQQPDAAELERLRIEDPMQYVLQREAMRDREAQIDQARQEYERIAAEEQQRTDAEKHRTLQKEAEKLLEALPTWKDPAKRGADKQAIKGYCNKLGWTDEEVAAVTDHRAVLVLYKAMKYDAALARKPVPERPAPRAPVVAPQAARPVPSRQVTEVTRARQRLAKTHDAKDAAAVIEHLL